ncbi:hypothetical protein [Alteribacter populi]|uniref:hypothetical protein n=1 Tax=Alteribacter populi TaxID=2011011 RepID=UPI000BBAB634|nr:hypothetical protein [Alteribacter populi]
MESILFSSLQRMQRIEQLQSLLNRTNLEVCVICDENKWYFSIKGQRNDVRPFTGEKSDVVIEGRLEELKQFLYGDDFLLSMKKRGQIGVEGCLNDLLTLESLWYLSNV